MTAWTQFRLKNSMLLAAVAANMLGGLSMDILILIGDAPPPPDILRVATYLDLTFMPVAFLIMIGFTLWYEMPMRRFIRWRAGGRTIPGHLRRLAQKRLLNEPFMLIIASGSLWFYGTILYPGLFWISGADSLELQRAFFRSLGNGLITVVAAFFLLESILQKWLAPVLFPNGDLSKTPRVFRMRLGMRLGALLLACNVVPLLTIVGATLRITEVAANQDMLVTMIRRAIIVDASVFIIVGAFLTGMVSRNISQSMDAIIGVLKRIRNRDLDRKVRVTSNDEIGYAGDVINEMAEGLKERNAMRRSLALAREVQQLLVPPTDIETPEGFQIAGRSVYCDETGGDYLDVFPLDIGGRPCMALAVGDVAGHGVSSALLMVTVRAALHQRAILAGSPAQIVTDVNRQLARDVEASGQFMTLFFVVLDPNNRSLGWVRAGHDPALLYDPRRDMFNILKGEGMALGIDAGWPFVSYTRTAFEEGQILLIGTDGIWEARNRYREMFGKRALRGLIRQYAQLDARHIRDEIFKALSQFQKNTRPEDDITLMVVKAGPKRP
ncbi:MAG: SpoIIE family protein phosphatase [Desulfobacterales bacterium]|jgi:sigma-B regulation protein RsbU (phosphoserine phosphatase)